MRMQRFARPSAAAALVLLGTTALVGCSGSDGPGSGEGSLAENNRLVVYSSHGDTDAESYIEVIESAFPGIQLEWVSGGTGETLTRIGAEAGNPQADLMLGGLNNMDGDENLDLFEEWLTDQEDTLQEEFRSPNGVYSLMHPSPTVILVNTDIEQELGLDIRGFDDLLDPALNGQVLINDPLSSAAGLDSLETIQTIFGVDSDEAWDYVEELMGNELVVASSSSAAISNIFEGEYAVSLTAETLAVSAIESGVPNVRIAYPEEGTSGFVGSNAVVKNAPNIDLAKEVLDYVMSPEGQTALAERTTLRYTTDTKLPERELIPPLEDVNWVERDPAEITDARPDVLERWQDIFTANNS